MNGILTEPMIDPFGSVLRELRDDVDLRDLVDGRVRGHEPGPDDAKGPGEYLAFVVLVAFDDPPHPSLPIQRAVYGANCYGVTPQNARAVWGAVVAAMHRVGGRVKANGLGIYISGIEGGGDADSDPRTNQPVVRGTIRVWATAQAVA